MVVCAGGSDDWERTACVAREHGLAYMLGIHPLLVPKAHEEDLEMFQSADAQEWLTKEKRLERVRHGASEPADTA